MDSLPDPLSEVLSLLKPRSFVTAALTAGGDWSLHFPRHNAMKFQAVISGECWLTVEGITEPVRLQPGDCFLLTQGRPFGLSSDTSLAPTDAKTIFPPAQRGGMVSFNGGGDFLIVGSLFTLASSQAPVLVSVLPPIVHIRQESDRAALRWTLDRMMEEGRDRQAGSSLIAQHLAHIILVQTLRLHLAEGARGGVGWLFALADPQMSTAMQALHADPAHRWSIQELAERVGMSRSSFALKFKETVGSSPMDYLARWRMLLAEDRLETTTDPISTIALSLGYESESAFSTAFKRIMGCSPRQFSRIRHPQVVAARGRREQLQPVAD